MLDNQIFLFKISFIICILLIIGLVGLVLNKSSNLCACQEAYEASIKSQKMKQMEKKKKTFFEFTNNEYLKFPKLESVDAWCTCIEDKSVILNMSPSIEKYAKISEDCPIKLIDFLKHNIDKFDSSNNYKLVGSYVTK